LTQTKVADKKDIYGNGTDDAGTVNLITTRTYDKQGNMLTETDANGIKTTYTYDLADHKLSRSQPGLNESNTAVSAIKTAWTYAWDGQILTETNALNRKTTHEYDARGFLIKTTNASGGITIYAYDRAGRKTDQVDPKNYLTGQPLTDMGRTGWRYDAMGRVLRELKIQEQRPEDVNANIFHKWEYDTLGRVVQETLPNGGIYTFSYTAMNMLQAKYLDGTRLEYNYYDLAGRLTQRINAKSKSTYWTYNRLGLTRTQQTSTDATIPQNTVTHQYDGLGRLRMTLDSLNCMNIWTYNNQGQVLTHSEELSGNSANQRIQESWRYDVAGNQRYAIDGRGYTATQTFDALNRLVSHTQGGRTTTYTYDSPDPDSPVRATTDWRGNVYTDAYDALNRLVQRQDPFAVIEKRAYNNTHLLTKTTDALNKSTTYAYDNNNRLITVTDPMGHKTQYTYDAMDNIATETVVDSQNSANSRTTAYSYNHSNWLTAVKDAKGQTTSYTYDNMGNVLTQVQNGKTTSYQYNVMDLRTRKTEPDSTRYESYTRVRKHIA
jgi:YD repeat-containing protein